MVRSVAPLKFQPQKKSKKGNLSDPYPGQGLYCVASSADRAAVTRLRKLGVPVMDKEWLLTGIIRHKLDPALVLQ